MHITGCGSEYSHGALYAARCRIQGIQQQIREFREDADPGYERGIPPKWERCDRHVSAMSILSARTIQLPSAGFSFPPSQTNLLLFLQE